MLLNLEKAEGVILEYQNNESIYKSLPIFRVKLKSIWKMEEILFQEWQVTCLVMVKPVST